jgi:predicted lipoprotein
VKRRAFVAGCAALGAGAGFELALGCGPTEIEDERRKLLSGWGQKFLLGSYTELEARAGELETAARALCEAPAADTLEAARSAWWAARAPWKRTEVFAFGPYSDEPQRFGPQIDFWPARPDTVEATLSGSAALTPEAAASFGAPAKGFPAIEYLLFQPGVDVLGAFLGTPRRCEYLLAIAADLITQTRALSAAWDPSQGNYLGELTGAGKTSAHFESLQLALGEIVNRMGYTLENIRAEKLGKPLGTTSGGTPQPDKAESPFSGRAIEDIRDNLRGIERLYFGDGGAAGAGLEGYLVQRGKSFARLMRGELDASFGALAAIEPLSEAIVARRAQVEAAIERLGALQRAIQVDVINALALSVGFNDNDGD